MRKIISFLVLATLLLLPIVVLAQVKECCHLKRAIIYEKVTYNQNIWIAGKPVAANECGTGSPALTSPANDCPVPTAAIPNPTAASSCITPDWGTICLLNSINRVFDWVFVIIMAMVGIMVVVGAFSIITAGGDPGKVSSGRSWILYAIIGMVVALFARAIPAIVASLIG